MRPEQRRFQDQARRAQDQARATARAAADRSRQQSQAFTDRSRANNDRDRRVRAQQDQARLNLWEQQRRRRAYDPGPSGSGDQLWTGATAGPSYEATHRPPRRRPSGFEILSLLVTLVAIALGIAEITNRVWGVGPAPSDVAVDLYERVREAADHDPANTVGSADSNELVEDIEDSADITRKAIEDQIDGEPPAIPSNLHIAAAAGCDATLAWNAVTDPDLDFYIVSDGSGIEYAVDSSRTSREVSVFPGTSATFAVQARDEHGNESQLSNEVTVSC